MNSVIIPTYCPTPEVAVLLQRCLASLFACSADPYELIIVEQGDKYCCAKDASLCNTRQIVCRVLYDYHRHPIGYAAAVNRGMEMATGDYLFIVNNDIEVPSSWDRDLLRVYQEEPKIGLLSPVDRDGLVGVFEESWWSCVLISRKVWNEVGPLDDKDLNYRFHDQDWSIRCTKAGYKVRRYAGVRVEHKESSTYRHMTTDETAERAVMRSRYGHEHFYQWVQAGRP